MSDLTTRANQALAALQDYTRDLEADLGKITRNRTNNPSYDAVDPFVPVDQHPRDIAQQNHNLAVRTLEAYGRQAAAAMADFNGLNVDGEDRVAVERVAGLVAAINGVKDVDDARKLVATFKAA